MRNKHWLPLLMTAAISAAAQPVSAGDWSESPLGRAEFGELWSGPPFETVDLAGKVVLVKTWSDKCGFCVRAMPGLASYEKTLRERGLVVLGACCKDDKRNALKVAKKSNVEFRIVHGAKLPDTKRMSRLPQYVLYDRNGQIIYQQEGSEDKDGLSSELKTALEQALGSSVDVLIIDLKQFQEKRVARFAKRAGKAKGLGRLLSQIENVITEGTEAEKAEAQLLKTEIVAYGEQMLAEAEKLRQERPHRHFDMVKKIAKAFKGHEIGEKANAIYQPLKRDPQAKKEIAAAQLYEELQTASEKEKKSLYKKIKKKYADTRFGKRALEEMPTDDG